MRVTRQQAAENRDRVLGLSSRLFRERGIHGVAVADLMREAGLTHGAFYKQFASKDDLVEKASAFAIADNLAVYEALAKKSPRHPLRAIINALVSERHRDDPGDSCAMAALGSDLSRSPEAVRRAASGGVRRILDCLTSLFQGQKARSARREAIAAYATIVGALVISRAVDDPELSREILDASRRAILDRAGEE